MKGKKIYAIAKYVQNKIKNLCIIICFYTSFCCAVVNVFVVVVVFVVF